MDAGALNEELRAQGVDHLPPDVMVFEIDGPMFFGAVENFERALMQTHTDPAALLIRLRRVPFMDITGIQTLGETIDDLTRRKVRVMLCEANERVLAKLAKAGVLDKLGDTGYQQDFATAAAQLSAASKPPL
jgi:SulP family sulfate permease